MKPQGPRREPSDPPAPAKDGTHPAGARLWERILSRRNLAQALRRIDAGVMVDATKQPTERGTPQGSPLSPLLSNVYLTDLDKELDRRGHLLRPLRRRPRDLHEVQAGGRAGHGERQRVDGWVGYFHIAGTPRPFEDLDEWLRRRLRQARWKQWKRIRTKMRNLRSLGVPEQKAYEWANTRKGSWRIAGSAPLQRAMPKAYWRNQGLVGFSDSYRRRRDAERAARCGPACLVAWEGPG